MSDFEQCSNRLQHMNDAKTIISPNTSFGDLINHGDNTFKIM